MGNPTHHAMADYIGEMVLLAPSPLVDKSFLIIGMSTFVMWDSRGL